MNAIESLLKGNVSDLLDSIPDSEILKALQMKVSEETLRRIATKLPTNDSVLRLRFHCEKTFVWYIANRLSRVDLPIFKVVTPCDTRTGANYYIVWGQEPDGTEVVAFFRGTYGYGGMDHFNRLSWRNSSKCSDIAWKSVAAITCYHFSGFRRDRYERADDRSTD